MLKWIGYFVSYFVGRLGSPLFATLRGAAQNAIDEVTFKSRKIISLTVLSIASVVFICGGFFIALLDATKQYDQNGIIFISATFIAGTLLALVAAGVFVWIFTTAWPRTTARYPDNKYDEESPRRNPSPPLSTPSNIEQALSALILDIIKEREEKRAKRTSEEHLKPIPESEMPSMYPH